ncbi:MAG: glycosyltransferase family 4 protein [Candidatus Sulfotelmatobacter sp.]
MRILFCNKYNYPFSGTEAYLFEAMELLRSRGHEVALFSMADPRGAATAYDRHFVPHIDFTKPGGWIQKISSAAHVIYSREARLKIRAMIAQFQPDVAHVRNIYHHLSPSILWELKAQRIPVVYHINDFKVLCPSYNLVAHGEACEACKGGDFRHALKLKCYPGSGARMMLVAEAYVHKWMGTYRKCVDCFLAPSEFVRDKFVEHGWDRARFEVLPHFQLVKEIAVPQMENAPLLYFGRLSAEKGVSDLLHAMQRLPAFRLRVAGDGPERGNLEALAAQLKLTNVEFTGQMGKAELDRALADSRFTVLPSHAYETLGKTILESYAQGRAVIATDLGSRRELVRGGTTGLLYEAGDIEHLAAAIQFLGSRPELAVKMGSAGSELLRRHTPDAHYESLIALYERLARGKQLSSPTATPGPLLRQKVSIVAPSPPILKPALRIAFIGGRGVVSKYSGVETYYEEVGRRLASMGHHVTIYCRAYFTPRNKRHNGMQIVRLPTIRSKHLETLVHTFLSTLHVLTQPCDIVHYHALGPALFAFIPRLLGKKSVVTVQGRDWQRKKWGRIASAVLRLGERAALSFPNKTIVVSRTLQENYRQGFGAETSYIPNGGVLRDFRFPEKIFDWGLDPGKYILFLGRFSPEKGCHLLIEAFENLQTEAKLVMAGAAGYSDTYARELRTHASERIKILDWVSGDALDELLTNAMIFVLPSDLEGLSLALLDAMGAGLCVLASDVAENREAIEGAGFTFRSGCVADLTERLKFLIANPSVREAAGQAAKLRVREHYQWTRIAEEIERVYFEMTALSLVEIAAKRPPARAIELDSGASRRTG